MNEDLIEARYDITKKSQLRRFYESNKILIFSSIFVFAIILISFSVYFENKENRDGYFTGRWQIHFGSAQFMDEKDHELPDEDTCTPSWGARKHRESGTGRHHGQRPRFADYWTTLLPDSALGPAPIPPQVLLVEPVGDKNPALILADVT